MSGIDLTGELADLRTVFNDVVEDGFAQASWAGTGWATSGDIAIMRDSGRIAWPGEPFEQPQPTGDPGEPTFWLDIDLGRIGAEIETFGVEMMRTNLDVGCFVEIGPGADYKVRSLCDAIKAMLQSADTASMMFYPWEAYPIEQGPWEKRWFRVDYQIPYERREAL